MVGDGPHLGVGADRRHARWSMVQGGSDYTWRTLHPDLPPAQRRRLGALADRFAAAALEAPVPDAQRAAVLHDMPDILPFLARLGAAAVEEEWHELHPAFPALLRMIIDADVGTPWRPLQV